ncbi:MAG TPA: hypothetical protein V6C78_15300 [Crinalium sp.]|jgi:hypothetical protein
MNKQPNRIKHASKSSNKLLLILAGLMGAVISFLPSQSARADSQETLFLLTELPLEAQLLEPGAQLPKDGSIRTADTISQSGLTSPSLWWTDEQFGGKLLDNWLAYSGSDGTPRRVDLVVNPQVWSLYTYVERYAFVNQFGTAAWNYGYSTRVFTQQQDLLAAYICDPATTSSSSSTAPAGQPSCTLFLNSSGTGSLRGQQSNPFGGG